jgi:hypothetical protein
MNTLLVIAFIWQSQPHAAHFRTCHKQTRFRRRLETPCEIKFKFVNTNKDMDKVMPGLILQNVISNWLVIEFNKKLLIHFCFRPLFISILQRNVSYIFNSQLKEIFHLLPVSYCSYAANTLLRLKFILL